MNSVNLFVPGRVSIIGELSDIVVDYINENETILPGEVIAGGIDKGIYATVCKSKDFIFEYNNDKFIVEDMKLSDLKKIAKNKNFYSYVSSVAYLMKKKYKTSGVFIKVRCMTLPIQKGLSSSASVCVLVTKAFNILYNLKLDYSEIMEIAYQAERYAHSMCGRLDQICAKGLGVSHIVFYQDKLDINKLNIKKELNFVIADLNGFKDTKKILSTLHSCFPFPKNEDEEAVKKTLCEDNKYLVHEAISAIEKGNLKYLGQILSKAQENLDKNAGKICDALEGVILHKIMNDQFIKANSYGSKGTGSNGDGSIVILVKNKLAQKQTINYLSDTYKMNSFEFNIKKTYSITTAIINTFNNKFNELKALKVLEKLDTLNFDKILVFGNCEVIEKYNKLLNKEYNDTNREYLIKLCRIYEKIEFINLEKYNIQELSKYNEDVSLYIPNYNVNGIKKVLDNYEFDNKKDLLYNLNEVSIIRKV